ncbi:MAG: hypothetical protein AAB492_02445 [Patescibacteria group bacterium]
MTKNFCDQCKKEILQDDGPIHISFVHYANGQTICLACFSKLSVWKKLQQDAKKEIAQNIKFHSHRIKLLKS